jgi:carbamoyltransferase
VIILSISTGIHDSGAAIFNDYEIVAAVQEERLTRKKGDGGQLPLNSINEVLQQSGFKKSDITALVLGHGLYPDKYFKTVGSIRKYLKKIERKQFNLSTELGRANTTNAEEVLDAPRLALDLGLSKNVEIHFYNHHLAHALSALAYTDWKEAFLYTADAGGDNIQYSQHLFKEDAIKTLAGTSNDILSEQRVDSIGAAYGYVTQALGFKMNRHEGKLTGLAAYGQPTLYEDFSGYFSVSESGVISTNFKSYREMRSTLISKVKEYIQSASNEFQAKADAAASIQKLLENVILESLKQIQKKHAFTKLGLAGGVFANVKLNRFILENLNIDEIFIFPGMGDEGLIVGGAHDFLIKKYGVEHWANSRKRLENVYWGKCYGKEFLQTFDESNFTIKFETADIAKSTAEMLAEGKVGAIFSGRMEFGPRALGARTIIASPVNKSVNETINERLQRTEFMPFAPYVLESDAKSVFAINTGNLYAAKFMTITTEVNPKWAKKIPAVVHIDNSARPQIVTPEQNKLYAEILTNFKEITGLPVLVNTSFNAHEEPIINTPRECLNALINNRVDFVVNEAGIYFLSKE